MWERSGNAELDGLSYSGQSGNDVNVEKEDRREFVKSKGVKADAQSINTTIISLV